MGIADELQKEKLKFYKHERDGPIGAGFLGGSRFILRAQERESGARSQASKGKREANLKEKSRHRSQNNEGTT